MSQDYRTPNSLHGYAAAYGVLGILVLLFSINPETIPAGGGFGYDGVTYARMVVELDRMISQGELSEYFARRILPSLMVRGGLEALGLPIESASIIGGFRVLNGLLMVTALWFWIGIAQRIRLTPVAFWTGFLGLFLIYPNAKQLFYYPVLTDTFAFAIGLAMAWAYLSGRTVLVAGIAIVGALGWQMADLIGAALVASTLVRAGPINEARAERIGSRLILAFFALSLVLGLAIGLRHMLGVNLEQVTVGRSAPADPMLRFLTNLPALALAGGFVVYLSACTVAAPWQRRIGLRQMAEVLLLLAAIVAIPNAIVSFIANSQIPPPGLAGFDKILKALLFSRAREGLILLPVVAHAVYYGPVFLLLLLLWRPVARMTVELGAGFVFVMAVFVVLSVFAESRFTFMLWPFVVTVVCKVVGERGLPKLTQGLVVLGALGFSKAWLVINQGPWPKPDYEALKEWPKSVYFSSHGSVMTVDDYLLQGAFIAVLFVLLYVTKRHGEAVHSVGLGRN